MKRIDGTWEKALSSWEELLQEELPGREVSIDGAIHSIRNMGEVMFVILRKKEGLFQTVFDNPRENPYAHGLKEGMTVKFPGIYGKRNGRPMDGKFRFSTLLFCPRRQHLFPWQSINGSFTPHWRLN